MSVDARKRQKKLEKQRAKKKAERKAIARRESGGMPARLQAAAVAPILHCCHATTLWEHGMGNVLVSRELRSGNVAFVMFLVDVYCLGVKDVFCDVVPRTVYDNRVFDKLLKQGPVRHIQPEAARKLVEGAVEFARRFDLEPHPDYRVGKLIFGDIVAGACTQEFVYGKNGKPYFFAGPHDSPDRCHFIMRALERSCGSGGYHYTIPVVNPDELDFIESPADE
jgi:hypothetical protein